MKKLMPVAFLLSVSAYATDVSPTMKKGIDTVAQPLKLGTVECDPNDPNAPVWCKDLYKSVCEVKKTSDKLGELNKTVNTLTWKKLPSNAVMKQKNAAGEMAIKMADELVYKQGRVIRKDVVDTFMETKTILFSMITGSPSIPRNKQAELTKAIRDAQLRTGYEYVQELIEYNLEQDPGLPKDEAKYNALQTYISSCGENGLELNAFNDHGSLVLCPGLIYSFEDYNPKGKQEILNALSFTIGHELGHSIDNYEQPQVYSKMQNCYETTTKDPKVWEKAQASEIVGDYWGTLVLGQRLKNQKVPPQDAIKTVAYAMDGFCSATPKDKHSNSDPHPPGEFRVNFTIAKAPLIREALTCEPPSKENPACTLDGAKTSVGRGN